LTDAAGARNLPRVRRHHPTTDWSTLALLALQHALFWGNLVLWRTHPLPLAVHVGVGIVAVHLAFTIWHEAVHRNVSRSKLLNDAVGVLGMLPYGTPFFLQRWVHLEHHRRLNEPADPNLVYAEGSFWTLPLRYPRALRYAKQVLRDDPRTPGERLADRLVTAALAVTWGAALWLGAFVDLLLLWALPLVVAKLLMDWYINWLPHVGLPADRFAGTRIVDVPWLTPLVLAHNYHAVHHLWPGIPWHRYPAVFREKHGYLVQHGVPIEHAVLVARPSTVLCERPRSSVG
jgi:fatty acid desaturase